MPIPTLLPVSRLINVSVNLSPQAAQGQNLSTLLLLGTSTVIDVVTRMRTYGSIDQVAADFGTSADEYLAAVLWFEQNPQPTQLLVGRWAKTDSHGQLICATLSATNTLVSTWTAITNGSFHVTVDGGSPQSLTGLNFSSVTNLNGVATVINGTLTGATAAYNAVFNRFEFTSNTTGASSSISFLTAGSGGTDVAPKLAGRSSDSGAYVANGIVAETALAVVTLFDFQFGPQWYAVEVLEAADADHLAIGPFIEATTNKHYYGVTTQSAGVLVANDTSNIAAELAALKLNKTGVQFSSSNGFAMTSLLGRILPTNYNANDSVITLFYKQEPGITGENLNPTQITALEAKNANVFVNYNNNTAIIEPGVSSSGNFIDEVIGADALAISLQTAVFNVLFTAPTKVPQTDAGIHSIVTAIEAILSQFVSNGYLAPGTWNAAGFGAITNGTFLPKGYYVFVPSVATQSQADRAKRVTPTIQIAAKLAGAVHTAQLAITVNA